MKQYAIYLCGVPTDKRVIPNPDCPEASRHTPVPPGYMQWIDWAEDMNETHIQRRCPGCDSCLIWEPREVAP